VRAQKNFTAVAEWVKLALLRSIQCLVSPKSLELFT